MYCCSYVPVCVVTRVCCASHMSSPSKHSMTHMTHTKHFLHDTYTSYRHTPRPNHMHIHINKHNTTSHGKRRQRETGKRREYEREEKRQREIRREKHCQFQTGPRGNLFPESNSKLGLRELIWICFSVLEDSELASSRWCFQP